MGMTTNGVLDLIPVQSSSANKVQNSGNASSQDNDFRKLLETQQSANQSGMTSNRKPDGATDADSSNSAPNRGQSDSDDLELNKQMMLAAMMFKQTPVVVPEAHEDAQADAAVANAEGVQEILGAQNPGVAQTQSENGQLAADVLSGESANAEKSAAEMKQPELPTEKKASEASEQPKLDTQVKQTARPGEDASRPVKQMKDLPEFTAKVTDAQSQKDTGAQKDTAVQNQGADIPLFRKVETMPIRVGDASAAEGKAAAEVPAQIAKQLAGPIRGKISTVELELNPRSLGRVHVEMKWMDDGSLHVMMKAEKLGTQAMLERSAGSLQGLLERDAQQTVRVDVQQPQEDAQPNNHNGGQQQEQQQNSRHDRGAQQQDMDNRFLQELRLGLTSINDF